MRRMLGLLLICTLGTGEVLAQLQISVLASAYRDALDHDATYRAARDEARAAREQVDQARAAWRPGVVVNASALRNHLDQSIGGASRSADYGSSSLSLQWRQPLVSRELDSREAMARLRAEQAEALMAVRHDDLTRRLVDAYLELARAERASAFVRDELARQAELVETARKGLNSGEGTVTELLEASSRVELLQAQRVSAEAGRDDALDRLAVITGRQGGWARVQTEATASTGAALPPAPEAGAIESALSEHPQRRFRRFALDMALEEVRLVRAVNAPRLDWIASASRGDSDAVNSFNQINNLWSAGVQFTLPLFDGGRADSGARAAQALVDKAQAELDDTERTLSAEARQTLRALNASTERTQALRSAQKATEQLVMATRRSLAAGLRSRVDLLLAERQLAQVQREQDQATIDHLRSWWRAIALQRRTVEVDLLTLERALQ